MVLRRTMPLLVALMVLMLGAQLWSPAALRAADAALVAADTFGRTTSGGWGQADTGGTYRLLGGSATDYSVSNTVGRLLVTTSGSGRVALLPGTQAADVDITVQVQSNKVALGGNQYAYVVARRTTAGDEYRTQIRFEPSGAVRLRASRMIAGQETLLGTDVTVPNVTHAAGKRFWLRVQVTGQPVTVIRARSWLVGATEATTWQVQVSDQAASLQTAGAVGLRSYLNSNTRNAPVSFGFAQWTVKVLMTEPSSPTLTMEPVRIKDTAYPIPPLAYFVATNGNDSNSGMETAPWRTIAKAVAAAPTGATIVLRGGIYRESVTISNKAFTLQPYPHEQVWMKGSQVVTGWIADKAFWRKDGWTYKFPHTLPGNNQAFINPAYPFAHYPDMVFINGLRVTQVGQLSELGPNTFYVDYKTEQLYLGSDPTGKVVEAAFKDQALSINYPGSVVRGLGFMHYATHRDQFGMVQGNATRLKFEDNTFAWSAAQGLFVKADTIVRGNTVAYNGLIGINAYVADRSVFENNLITYNNIERFDAWENGGVKFARSYNTLWRDNVIAHNFGKGLWGDFSNYNTTIIRNKVYENLTQGIMYEISGKALIADNIVYRNGAHGIYILESSQVQVYNNTVVSSGERDIQISESNRPTKLHKLTKPEIALGITHDVLDIEIRNNILSNTDGSHSLIGVQDHRSNRAVRRSAEAMTVTSDYNVYHRTRATNPMQLSIWAAGSAEPSYTDLLDFFQSRGQEAHSLSISGASNTLFVDASYDDYRLTKDNPVINAGTLLPQSIADVLGVTAGVPVNMGALHNTP